MPVTSPQLVPSVVLGVVLLLAFVPVRLVATMSGIISRPVTLPLATPGLLASAVIAFIASFDERVVTRSLSGPRFTTLPVAVFHYVTNRTDPLAAALSTLLPVGHGGAHHRHRAIDRRGECGRSGDAMRSRRVAG